MEPFIRGLWMAGALGLYLFLSDAPLRWAAFVCYLVSTIERRAGRYLHGAPFFEG
jgi:hypothetical protein